jgi:hypothetical protein
MGHSAFVRAVKDVANRKNAAAAPEAAAVDPVLAAAGAVTAALDAGRSTVAQADSAAAASEGPTEWESARKRKDSAVQEVVANVKRFMRGLLLHAFQRQEEDL